jgi:hypothetical protein
MEEFSPEWFDYSSKMWLQNKKRKGHSYIYVCKKEKCSNTPHLRTDWCKWHHPQKEIISNGELRRSPRIAEKN